LSESEPKGDCGAGKTLLAVDADGNLYPCEGFIGRENMRIGNLDQGLDRSRRGRFINACREAGKVCFDCDIRNYCVGGCYATGTDEGVSLNSKDGCVFARKVADIGMKSYQILVK
jgi:uncharacterized protein